MITALNSLEMSYLLNTIAIFVDPCEVSTSDNVQRYVVRVPFTLVRGCLGDRLHHLPEAGLHKFLDLNEEEPREEEKEENTLNSVSYLVCFVWSNK